MAIPIEVAVARRGVRKLEADLEHALRIVSQFAPEDQVDFEDEISAIEISLAFARLILAELLDSIDR